MNYIVKLKCNACNSIFEVDLEDLELSWEVVESEERGMGTELHHQAIVDLECPDCKVPITLTLDVWEYPLGVFNLDEIEVDGAIIVKKCALNGLAPIEY